MDNVLLTVIIAGAVTIFTVALTLVISFLVLRVKKLNSKERFINSLLPDLDCGKCNCPTCELFSKEVAEEQRDIAECPYIQKNNLFKAKRVLKSGYINNNNLVAFVKCKGGKDCKNKFEYNGPDYCWCNECLHSGNKQCEKACLGCGDCVKVCRYGALFINEKGVAEVDRTKCTGCGACINACPNDLIVRIPVKQHVAIVCNKFDGGMAINSTCKVGCTSCGLCAKNCPTKAITMEGNMPVIDESKCIHCNKCVGVCPNSCISRFE